MSTTMSPTVTATDLTRINSELGRNAPDLVSWALGLGQPANQQA